MLGANWQSHVCFLTLWRPPVERPRQTSSNVEFSVAAYLCSSCLSAFQGELARLAEVKNSLAIFCMATYGEGDPTDNAQDFYDWLQENDDEDLSGLTYTVSRFLKQCLYETHNNSWRTWTTTKPPALQKCTNLHFKKKKKKKNCK